MTCGKFYVQSCGLFWYVVSCYCMLSSPSPPTLWCLLVLEIDVIRLFCIRVLCRFLSTVYLVQMAPPKIAWTDSPIQAATLYLTVRRPRIAGGALTIPIDSTVRLVKCSRKEASHNIIRLQYGSAPHKCLVMRAVNSLEHEKWLVGIIRAMAAAATLVYREVCASVGNSPRDNTNTATSFTDTGTGITPSVYLAQHKCKHHPIAVLRRSFVLIRTASNSVSMHSQVLRMAFHRST